MSHARLYLSGGVMAKAAGRCRQGNHRVFRRRQVGFGVAYQVIIDPRMSEDFAGSFVSFGSMPIEIVQIKAPSPARSIKLLPVAVASDAI